MHDMKSRYDEGLFKKGFRFIFFVSYFHDITDITENPQPMVSSRLATALCVGNTITNQTRTRPRIIRNPLVAAPFPHYLRASDEGTRGLYYSP